MSKLPFRIMWNLFWYGLFYKPRMWAHWLWWLPDDLRRRYKGERCPDCGRQWHLWTNWGYCPVLEKTLDDFFRK